MLSKQQICMISWCIAGIALLGAPHTYAQQLLSYQDYFDYYDIQVVNNPGVDLTFPSWAKPNPTQDKTDLGYWVHEVLPFDEDKDADIYLVYPEHGIVIPVVTPTYDDQVLIAQGNVFDHYPYLEEGGLFYYGESPDQGPSNMVIAAHSSFSASEPGRYKTVFQALPISRAGDKIFLYMKNDDGSYDFYEYIIEESFETDPSNVEVLRAQAGKYTLTTYGCYVIGSNKDRWINIAELTQKKLAHSDLRAHAAAPAKEEQLVATTQSISIAETDTKKTNIDRRALISKNIQSGTTISSRTTHTPKTTTIKENIRTLLTARNQYVIADTLPPDILQSRIAARIGKGTPSLTASTASIVSTPKTTTNSYTMTMYKVMVEKASKDSSLAETLIKKLESLIPKLAAMTDKEKELAFMKDLYNTLQSYTQSHTLVIKNDKEHTVANEEGVTILENGKRFLRK